MLVLALIYTVLGAVWRRWMGGWEGAKRWIQMVVAFALASSYAFILSDGDIWALGVGLLFLGAMTPGHGSYMDMGRSPGPDNEKVIAPILDLFFKTRDSGFARDFAGMLLRYLILGTIPIGAYMVFVLGLSGGVYYVAMGILPAIGYALAWAVKKLPTGGGGFLAGATSYGELIIGAAFIGGLGVSTLPLSLILPF